MSLSFLPIPAGMEAALTQNGSAAGLHRTQREEVDCCKAECPSDEEDGLCDLNMPLHVTFSSPSNGEVDANGDCIPNHSSATSLGQESWRSNGSVGAERNTPGENGASSGNPGNRRKSRPPKRLIDTQCSVYSESETDEATFSKRKCAEEIVVKQEPGAVDGEPSTSAFVSDEYFSHLFADPSQSGGAAALMLEAGEDEDMSTDVQSSVQRGALFPVHPSGARKKALGPRRNSGRTAPVPLASYAQRVIVCPPADRQHNVIDGTDFKLKEDYLNANPITYDNANMRQLFNRAIFSKRHSCKCRICNEDINNHDSFLHHFTVHQGKVKGASHSTKECPVCGKSFAQPRGLYKHMSVHVTKDLYACPLCTNHYSRMEKFKNHFGQNHPGYTEIQADFITLYTSMFRHIIRYNNLAYRFIN